MFAIAMIFLVLALVTLGASFFAHLRDYSGDIYRKVKDENDRQKKDRKTSGKKPPEN